jgi:SUMO ligase MMS21 Smc5/6 complex component
MFQFSYNCSTTCKHHVSMTSLTAMLRTSTQCKCPVAGCPKIWTKANASLDTTFQYKMEKFLRASQMQSQFLNENLGAEAFDIDSDE